MVTTRSSAQKKQNLATSDHYSPELSPTFSSSTNSSISILSSTTATKTVTETKTPLFNTNINNNNINNNNNSKPTPSSANHTPNINININPLFEAEKMVRQSTSLENSNDSNIIHTNNLHLHSDDDHDEDYIDIDFDNESSLEEETIPTISIRAIIQGGRRHSQRHEDHPLVKIRVRPNCLTKDALGRSIVQAINATTGVSMQYHSLDGDSPIEGMFLEDRGLFVPLDDILHSPLDYNESVFCLSPPLSHITPPPEPDMPTPPKDTFATKTKTPTGLSLFAIVAVTTYLLNKRSQIMFCGECVSQFFWNLFKLFLYAPFAFDQLFVHWPLEQLYRHGPSFLGWEGARLSSICARITYYGDESFWINNITECERTYAKKVAASMFVRKPIVYFLLCYTSFKTLTVLLSFRKAPKNDPDMEETFKAIHSIVRQLKKAAGKP